MQFYQDEKPPLVWCPKAGKVVVEFVEGVFEAEGDQVELLKADGYRFDKPIPSADPEPTQDLKEPDPPAFQDEKPKRGRKKK